MSKPKSIDIFAKLPNKVSCQRIRGGVRFHWVRKGIGFGTLTLVVKRGKLIVDDECMTVDFCASVVRQAIREATAPDAQKGQP